MEITEEMHAAKVAFDEETMGLLQPHLDAGADPAMLAATMLQFAAALTMRAMYFEGKASAREAFISSAARTFDAMVSERIRLATGN